MSSISEAMRQVFIDTYRLMELEKKYNYLNYGKYPYRDRKNSVQITADFNADAYSVNGLFTEESEYTQVYPPEIITSIEQVLIGTKQIYSDFVTVESEFTDNGDGSSTYTITQMKLLLAEYELFDTIVTRDLVEIEATTIQVLSYVFPFDCVPDGLGRLKLSF
jgi:hypothetical protein